MELDGKRERRDNAEVGNPLSLSGARNIII